MSIFQNEKISSLNIILLLIFKILNNPIETFINLYDIQHFQI